MSKVEKAEDPDDLMNANLSLKDMYSYFRMALVTGIVEKAAVIAWADNQLLLNPQTAYELVELSLAGRAELLPGGLVAQN